MFDVLTDFRVACESPEHIKPLGTKIDNNTSAELIAEVESFFSGKKVSTLDLGCSGGQFVVDLFKRGHRAVGIEGSDYSLRNRRANWPAYHKHLLFTADLTKPFEVFEDGNRPNLTVSRHGKF